MTEDRGLTQTAGTSTKEAETVEFVGRSQAAAPTQALREALAQAGAAMAAERIAPASLTAATFESDAPEAFHPARREVDLAWREAFAGFRPKLVVAAVDAPGLTVRLTARRDPPPSPEAAALAADYSPRRQADMTQVFRAWSVEGAAFRARARGLDLAYGDGPFETLDLYRPAGAARAPLWLFVHGGYWQACDKIQHAHFAQGMLAAGFACAMIDYGLAPQTPLEASVTQTVKALRFLQAEAEALGLEGSPAHLAGHSAGAHLAAMAATEPGAPPVGSLLLLSGVFDLAPLGGTPMGPLLGLDDPARAARLSPMRRAAPGVPVGLAYGTKETPAFAGQSARMAQRWGAPAPMAIEGRHHFDLLEELRADSPLLAMARRLAGS